MDSRSSPRYRFDGTCRIAPCVDPQLPCESEFLTVTCYNLSSAGFAFLLHNPPMFNTLVAAFTNSGQVVYMMAQVVHCTGVVGFTGSSHRLGAVR